MICRLSLVILVASVGCNSFQPRPQREENFDLVIANGRVMDPASGLDAIRHLGISSGKVLALSKTPLNGEVLIDATEKVVAPGFIDLNTYEHSDAFFRLRALDGVTSVLNLEEGAVDVDAYYDAMENRSLLHCGIGVSHGGLRILATSVDPLAIEDGMLLSAESSEVNHRPLEPVELERLEGLIEDGLRAGAVAVSFGIEYCPGATQSEILSIVNIAAKYRASAHMHLRDFESTRDWSQLNEVFGLAIRTGADIHVNHINSMFGSYSAETLEAIDRARNFGLGITTEAYPYTAGMTFIESALFDDWDSWPDEQFQRLEWPETGERLTRQTFSRYREAGGVVTIHPRDEAVQEAAVRGCLAHPLVMIASDGAWDGGKTHPRSAGTNSRVLGNYVRDEGVLTLMEAIEKMSLAPARHLERRVPSMRYKGRVQIGADADLVVFDPKTIIDRATYADSTRAPLGIEAVLVSGVPVARGGAIQEGVFPGQPIRAPQNE